MNHKSKHYFEDLNVIEESMNIEGLEEILSLPDIADQATFIFIDGTDDPFGINDIMFKMDEILAERSGLFDDCEEGKSMIIDFTQMSENEFHELFKEAAACVELENELAAMTIDPAGRNHYIS